MFRLFRIFLNQFVRNLSGLGILRILILLGLIFFAGAYVFSKISDSPNDYYFFALSLLFIVVIHLNRRDIKFLRITFNNHTVPVFFGYVILLTPVFVVYVLFQKELLLCISIICLFAISGYTGGYGRINRKIFLVNFLPEINFEIRAGLRKSGYFIPCIWLVGLIFSFFIASVPIALFLLGILSLSFYEKRESLTMIIAFEESGKTFILNKYKNIATYYSLAVLPLVVLYLVFHPLYWYVPLIELVALYSLQFYFICTKYSSIFTPETSFGNSLKLSIGTLLGLIPVLIPILWILSLRNYFKAKRNLNYYLDDFN